MVKLSLAAAAFGLALSASAANATAITVNNFSFETLGGALNNSCPGAGCGYTTATAIPDWVTTGSVGQFQPGSNALYFNSIPNGSIVAYSNGGTISQTVGVTALANTVYQLMVDVGFRKDITDPGTVSLLIGSTPVLAVGVPSQFSGNFVTYTAIFTTTAADAGKAITISLASATGQGDFDNVRLDATAAVAVPEPFTLSLFGAGLTGAFAMRRKKKGA